MSYRIGEVLYAEGDIILNEDKKTVEITVNNTGDRPIQVGSHFHFFEVNKYLDFKRETAFGYRLDIPSGTAVRFEPGEKKKVTLCEYGGKQVMIGFNGLTMGPVNDNLIKEQAMIRGKSLGFKGVK